MTVQHATETETEPTVEQAPYAYTDAQDHRLTIRPVHDSTHRPYVWFEAEDLTIGGALTNVWLPAEQARALDRHLDARTAYEFTDHTGDSLIVTLADDWTTFTGTRCAGDDEPDDTVPVAVPAAQIPELRAAITTVIEQAEQRAAARPAANDVHPADGEQSSPHPAPEPTVERPAGLDALLNAVAAGLVIPEERGRLAILDGRDALAFVVIRPDEGDPDSITVEAGAPHRSKAAVAYTLRQVADRMEEAALAEGDEPIPYPGAAGLSQVLEHMAASTRAHQTGPTHNAYRAGLRVAARLARQYADGRSISHDVALDVLAEQMPDAPRPSAVLGALADTLYDEERPSDLEAADAAARIVLAEHARELADGLREKEGHPQSLSYFPDTAPGMDRAINLLELHARKLMRAWPVATASSARERR
jgi:hypothetical protein